MTPTPSATPAIPTTTTTASTTRSEIAAGSDPLNAASTPEICDGIDNDLNDGIDEGFLDTDNDGLANCVDSDIDGDGFSNVVEERGGLEPVQQRFDT